VADDVWTGRGDGWNVEDPSNWSLGTVPGIGSTAVFNGGTVSVGSFYQGSSAFQPSAISIAGATHVTFVQDNGLTTYAVPTLDIGSGATVSFRDTNLIAGTLNNDGVLDLSQALPLGDGPKSPPGNTMALHWSEVNGFGTVILTAVVGAEYIYTRGSDIPYPGKMLITGAIDLGNSDASIENIVPQFGGDMNSYISVPTFAGAGIIADILEMNGTQIISSNHSASSGDYWAPGFTGSDTPYSALFSDLPTDVPTNKGNGSTPSIVSSPPCFATGTAILTVRGEVPVERLRPGMLVRTQNGRPAGVRWIGRRTVRVTEDTAPILVRANALAERTPFRDVRLSPDHAVLIGGVLIPAHRLRNGATISQDMSAGAITYWHVELDRHAVLFADGLPAESYLDTGNRRQFDAEIGVRPLYQELSADPLATAIATYAARGCAPLCRDGAVVEAAHAELAQRAGLLGWQMTDDPALEVIGDVPGISRCADDERVFLIPANSRSVRIVSRCFVPAEMDATRRDGRRLGVAVSVRCDGAALPKRSFDRGWYAPEEGAGWRWTDGDARLLIASRSGPCMLRIDVVATGARYWQAAPPRRDVRSVAGM
jgi:hypothetical protein